MRKIVTIILLLPLFSCNDWLDIEPEQSVTFMNYFQREQDLEDVLNSMLVNERSIFANDFGDAFGWSGLPCWNGGDYDGFRKLEPDSYLDRRIATYGVFGRENWTTHYKTIYYTNLLEENRSRFENISEERADYWIAQANFIKALVYFDLARRWGDVPFAPASESKDAVGKSPAKDVLEEAIRCANIALTLPTHDQLTDSQGKSVTSKQYASLGTVHTLLANIYAWMGGLYGDEEYWRKAEEHASLVIDKKVGVYELETSIDLMLKNTLGKNRVSSETIFGIEINSQDINREGTDIYECRYPGLKLMNYPHVVTDPTSIRTATDIPRIRVRDVEALYTDEDDVRRKEYWYKLGEPLGEEYEDDPEYVSYYAFLNKWRDPIYSEDPNINQWHTAPLAFEGNRVVWRLADLILLRGECRTRLNMATAKDDLDLIRERAGLKKYAGATDAESLRKEIFRERERELFGEGQRYYDIVRNGYFREELAGNYTTLEEEDIKNGALYLPIGSTAFDKNPLMKQNAYWLWRQ